MPLHWTEMLIPASDRKQSTACRCNWQNCHLQNEKKKRRVNFNGTVIFSIRDRDWLSHYQQSDNSKHHSTSATASKLATSSKLSSSNRLSQCRIDLRTPAHSLIYRFKEEMKTTLNLQNCPMASALITNNINCYFSKINKDKCTYKHFIY